MIESERIINAAILKSGSATEFEIGKRHSDIFRKYGKEVSNNFDAQGFVTSRGRFVNRTDAMVIAYSSGQVPKDVALRKNKTFNELFSEDLY